MPRLSFRILIYLLSIFVTIFLIFFVSTSIYIGSHVNIQCNFQSNCTDYLISKLNDESSSFKEKNSAIWALGQIGNKNSLETLKSYYTGNIPSKEPLDKTISQYELKKAISLIEKQNNLAGFIWKKFYKIY